MSKLAHFEITRRRGLNLTSDQRPLSPAEQTSLLRSWHTQVRADRRRLAAANETYRLQGCFEALWGPRLANVSAHRARAFMDCCGFPAVDTGAGPQPVCRRLGAPQQLPIAIQHRRGTLEPHCRDQHGTGAGAGCLTSTKGLCWKVGLVRPHRNCSREGAGRIGTPLPKHRRSPSGSSRGGQPCSRCARQSCTFRWFESRVQGAVRSSCDASHARCCIPRGL